MWFKRDAWRQQFGTAKNPFMIHGLTKKGERIKILKYYLSPFATVLT